MKEQRIKKISDGMKMLVAEIQDHWKVGAVQVISYTTEWVVLGKCVSDSHPVAEWRVGNFYILGTGPDLATAIQTALVPR
jgi:hypothetical protein